MKNFFSFAAAALLCLTGCTNPRISRDFTSGQIGCSPSEISIRNETAGIGGTHTWTAVCHGKEYICNYHVTTGSHCTPRQQESAATVLGDGAATAPNANSPWYQTPAK